MHRTGARCPGDGCAHLAVRPAEIGSLLRSTSRAAVAFVAEEDIDVNAHPSEARQKPLMVAFYLGPIAPARGRTGELDVVSDVETDMRLVVRGRTSNSSLSPLPARLKAPAGR
jgi:hypothetical protein